jgi:hypothetical protein
MASVSRLIKFEPLHIFYQTQKKCRDVWDQLSSMNNVVF